ncbi:MAG: hypothetical protein ACOYL1_06695 [Chlamydiia bacterium]
MSARVLSASSEELRPSVPTFNWGADRLKENLSLLKNKGAVALTCFAAYKILPLAKNGFLSLANKHPFISHGAIVMIALPVGAIAFGMYLVNNLKVLK